MDSGKGLYASIFFLYQCGGLTALPRPENADRRDAHCAVASNDVFALYEEILERKVVT